MIVTNATKVLFLITKGNWGGAQRAVFDLATSLPREKKYEVVVACGKGDVLPKKLAETHVRCEQLTALGRKIGVSDFVTFREIVPLLKIERPDILHLHSSKAAFLGALASSFYKLTNLQTSKLKTIFTVHGWPFNEPRGVLAQAGLWFLSWITALFSDAVIVLCRADLQSARRMLFIAHKAHLIPNGFAPQALKERGVARGVLTPDATPDATLIVTIAELTRNKGLSYALHAVSALSQEADLPPFRFIIIGEGELRPELEKIISENGLAEKVRLAGFIPDAKTLLSGADIFLLPSLKEGLPYVLLEAGAAGLPVVATSIGGIPDIVDDMQNGILVRPKREKEIVDALRFLLVNRKKREEFGTAFRNKVLRDFGFEEMLKETIAVYGL